MILCHERLHRCSDGFLVDRVFHVEVQATLIHRNIAAGDPVLEDRAQQVHRRVHAHVAIAPVPVKLEMHGLAGRRQRAAVFDPMQDLAGITVAGVRDPGAAARPAHRPCIAGLPAAERVEHGAVQDNRVALDRNDLGVAFPQIRVFAKEFIRHGAPRSADAEIPVQCDIRSPARQRRPNFTKSRRCAQNWLDESGKSDGIHPGAACVAR